MALYHFTAQVIKRSAGRSAVQCAAYRSGQSLKDERLGLTFDFTKKRGVIHCEIIAPEGAPAWVFERAQLWNAVEACAPRKDSQLAREIEFAIPQELSPSARQALVRAFVSEEFVSRGMIADIGIHEEDAAKPHAHVMLTMRDYDESGFGRKRTEWDKKPLFLHWRESWAVYANRALELEGHEARVDHRSYADRGLDLEPQPKVGRSRDEVLLDGRDMVHEQFAKYQRVAFENGERIRADPSIALRLITQQQATFSRDAILKVLNTHTRDSAQFDVCLSAVLASPELIRVASDSPGAERFTTREMLAAEREMLASAAALHADSRHRVAKKFVAQAIAAKPALASEQRRALAHLVAETGALGLLEGHAGTGKSFMLDAARDAWEAQGLVVVGAALAGKAAEGLELSSGIQARTLASWQRAWENGRDRLTPNHVLVIDEAGMVGTRQLGAVLAEAQRVGAKVVLVGDSRQLQAIEAGAPFRLLSHHVGAETLSEIRRQRVDWQREASASFAGGNALAALQAYHEHSCTHERATKEDARKAMVDAWAAHRLSEPGATSMLLAYRNEDVDAMNALARQHRCSRGELGAAQVVHTENGEREFAVGDRVYFGKNDRGIGVTNGSLGTLEHVANGTMVVRLDSGRLVAVDLENYAHLDHGYAVTIHKSQGVTVDRTFVMASRMLDSSGAYVAMTRHRDGVDLFWSNDEFRSRSHLDKVLSREKPKEMAVERMEQLPAPMVSKAIDAQSRPQAMREQLAKIETYLASRRLTNEQEVLANSPEMKDARAKELKARERLGRALQALEAYRAQGWLAKAVSSEAPYLAAFSVAEQDAKEAGRALAQLPYSRELLDRCGEIASKHNEPLVALHKRMQKLREQLELSRGAKPKGLERSGPSRRTGRDRGPER